MNYLEITTGDTRYTYATGRIRGLEKYLLKEAEFSRIKEGKDLAESFQELSRFYPYSDSMKVCQYPSEFERGLEEEWKRTYRELKSFVPEPELIDLFWIDQDFHNFKVLFKLKAQRKLPEDIERIENLSSAGTLHPRLVAEAVLREDFSNLPLFLRDIFQQVVGIIEKGAVPREIDFFLDRAYFKTFLSGMQSYRDGFLSELAKKIIDGYNLKNFLRIKFWEREDEKRLFEEVVVEGGDIKREAILSVATEPVDSFLEIIRGTDYAPLVKRAVDEWQQQKNLFTLEKALEERLLDFTYRGFYITFGRESVVNYVMVRRSEIRKIRGILRAKKANFSEAQMMEVGL